MTEERLLGGRPRLADLLRESKVERKLEDLGAGQFIGAQLIMPEHVARNAFRLVKLHGSLSWYWVREDIAGATLQRWWLPGTFGSVFSFDEDERRRLLPGEPFIVPPASLKSDHLRNPVTREMWRRAYRALGRAERAVLIGYSLPSADIAMGGLVAESLKGRPVKVEVVNLDEQHAEPVVARLVLLGIPRETIAVQAAAQEGCLGRWATNECDTLAVNVIKRLSTEGAVSGEEVLMVRGNRPAAVSEVVFPAGREGDALLKLDRPRTSGRVAKPATLRELLPHMRAIRRLVVDDEGRHLTVVDYEIDRQAGLEQVRFVPAGN